MNGYEDADKEEKPSRWWYSLPLLFGIIGGVFAFIWLLDSEYEDMGRFSLLLSVLITILDIAFSYVIIWFLPLFLSLGLLLWLRVFFGIVWLGILVFIALHLPD